MKGNKDKKSVLFLTRRFYPQIGGVETHVLKISEELIKRGFTVTIVAESQENQINFMNDELKAKWQSRYMSDKTMGEGDFLVKSIKTNETEVKTVTNDQASKFNQKGPELIKNIIVYRLPYVKPGRLKKFFIWYWFLRNRKIIEASDIVHCHDVFFWYLPFRFLFPKKPVFTTFHGYEKFPIPRKNIIVRKISEKLSWGNICVGKFIEKWYGTKADYITYGGVDRKIQNSKLKIQSYNAKIKILFVGRG